MTVPQQQDARMPYYEDDFVTLYHGDALEILPLIQGGIVLTDPPYGIGVRYGKGSDDGRSDYWEWFRSAVAAMRTSAPIVVFTHRVSALKEIDDWDWVGTWTKSLSTGARLGNSCVLPHWEPVFLYGIHTLGTASKFAPDVFRFNPVRVRDHGGIRGREGWATKDAKDHPTPKPPELFGTLLDVFGQHGGTVIDPFAGSGTTLTVAKARGRKAVGIEIEERFCDCIAESCSQEVLPLEGVA